jgi:GGDEF domain-containing protein
MANQQHHDVPPPSLAQGKFSIHDFRLPSARARGSRSGRTLSRAWASICVGLSALACAASLAWMLTAPDGRLEARASAAALKEVNQRLLLGGIGAVMSLGIGIIGVLCWPRKSRLTTRGGAPPLSTYDGMTGLPTRRLFDVLLTQALARAETTSRLVAVLVIDLVHYGVGSPSDRLPTNGVGSHARREEGDQPPGAARKGLPTPLVVRVQAARIKSVIHAHDALARLDERRFAVVLDNVQQAAEFLATARAIRQTIGLPLQIEGQELLLSCRIGGAIAPWDGVEADGLLKKAALMLSQSQDDDGAIAFASDPTTGHAFGRPPSGRFSATENRFSNQLTTGG